MGTIAELVLLVDFIPKYTELADTRCENFHTQTRPSSPPEKTFIINISLETQNNLLIFCQVKMNYNKRSIIPETINELSNDQRTTVTD